MYNTLEIASSQHENTWLTNNGGSIEGGVSNSLYVFCYGISVAAGDQSLGWTNIYTNDMIVTTMMEVARSYFLILRINRLHISSLIMFYLSNTAGTVMWTIGIRLSRVLNL